MIFYLAFQNLKCKIINSCIIIKMIDSTFDINIYKSSILLFAGIFSGLTNAIVGCGSLITMPIMFLIGMPAYVAIGSNKVQGVFGGCFSLYFYYKKGLINIKNLIKPFICVLIFSAIGAITVKLVPEQDIGKVLPFISLILLIYKVKNFTHGVTMNAIKTYPLDGKLLILCATIVGFYDGFLGPATGSIWISILVAFFGYNLLSASATSKFLNLAGDLGGVPFFLFSGIFSIKAIILMTLGQFIGTKLGVHLSIKHGSKFINIIFIIALLTMTVLLFIKFFI